MQEVKISYAQNREDVILEALIGDVSNGFYVDVGANDPHKDSVTKRFYLKGWHGINVEPNKLLWERLVFDRPRDINLRLGVGARNERLVFREYLRGDGLSTFSEAMKAENAIRETTYKDYGVEVKTLATIFNDNEVSEIDILKVDVEGFEWEVIQGNDWKKYRPKVICIEANHAVRLQKWHEFFEKKNYTFVFFDGINEYYRDDSRGPWPVFSYPEAILSRPIVTHSQYLEESRLKTEVSKLNRELDFARNHIRYLWKDAENRQMHISVMANEMQQMRRLRPATKTFVRAINNVIDQRIENMNKAPIRHVSYDDSRVISSRETDTATTLLDKIWRFDLKTNYRRNIVMPRPNRLAYRVLRKGYDTIKRIGKLGIKALRKVKKAV